jgi:plastocyanin
VLVDFRSDEFASFYLYNFPTKVTVRPGDTLAFKQTWTGEPHTITGGTIVSDQVRDGLDWIDFFESFDGMRGKGAAFPDPENPGDATFKDFATALHKATGVDALRARFVRAYANLRNKGVALPDLEQPPDTPFADLAQLVTTESDKAFSTMPNAFGDDDQITQNVGQPCFLRTGGPPDDAATPCDRADQRQPAFDGRFSFYNSGVIPYQGPNGNTFTMKIADDTAPGTYFFYCAVHGLLQHSEVEVRPKGTAIPSQDAVAREAQKEIDELTGPMRKAYLDAKRAGRIKVPGPDGAEVTVSGPFAGLAGGEHTAVNAFIPSRIQVKAGDPITWTMMGSDHTISFNVPKYFPPVQFDPDGSVHVNPKLQAAAGGAIPLPQSNDQDGPPGPKEHDGGTFDGTGFWSSGLIGADPYLSYTMRITKRGTYNYACLLHPPMVGSIVVT